MAARSTNATGARDVAPAIQPAPSPTDAADLVNAGTRTAGVRGIVSVIIARTVDLGTDAGPDPSCTPAQKPKSKEAPTLTKPGKYISTLMLESVPTTEIE